MSIASEIAADYSNKVREEWLARLIAARETKDWAAVNRIIQEIAEYRFTE